MPGEVRLASFEKRKHAFVPVIRFEATQLRFSFITKHLVQLRGFARINRVLRRCERDRRRRPQAFRELLQPRRLFRREKTVRKLCWA